MARSCSGWSTANYFSRADSAIQDEPLTLALWFTVTDLTTNQFLFSLSKSGAAPGGYYSLVFAGATANDPLRADKANDAGTAGSATVNTSASTNTWYFTAATFGSDTARSVYFGNAGVVTSGSDTTSVTNPTVANQNVGALKRSTVTAPASGSLALPTVWTAVLSLEEITALARGVHPARIRPESIARAWWNPTAASRLVDFSGGQNSLTLTGTVTDDAFGPPVEPFPYFYVPFLGIGAPLIETAGGTTVSVSTGKLELSGIVPTVSATANVSIATATGTLELSGQVAVAATTNHVTVGVDVGKLELSGIAPNVAAGGNQVAATDVGKLELLGIAPTIATTAHVTVNPTTGLLELTGQVPVILAGQSVTTASGALDLSGLAPTISTTANVTVTLSAGTLELLGIAPTITAGGPQTISPDVGTIVLTGIAPTILTTAYGALLVMSDAAATSLVLSDASSTTLVLNDNAVTTLTLSDAA